MIHSVRGVARTSRNDAIQQHFAGSFFQLRLTCNNPETWARGERIQAAGIGKSAGRELQRHFVGGSAPA
jgi:hypothetical protein